MEGFLGAFIATMVILGVIIRFKVLCRVGDRMQAEWQKRWNTLDENERKEKAQKEFESFKGICAAAISTANIFGIIFISLIVFASNTIVEALGVTSGDFGRAKLIPAGLILFFGIVPWLAIYCNSTALRARRYGVFHMGRRGRFLDIGFGAVALASLLLAVPVLRGGVLLVLYFILAGVSFYVLNAWVFFNRPPQES